MSTAARNLLILGAPRSGTTLLASMLSCHSLISVLNEDVHGSMFRILSKPVRGVKLCIPNQIELERRGSLLARLFKRHPPPKPLRPFVPEATSRLSIRDYQSLPNLTIVAILRDPADVAKSIVRRGDEPMEVVSGRIGRAAEILRTLQREDPDQLELVTFDSLVTDPRKVLEPLLERLGLAFEEKVLEGYRHTPQYRDRGSIDASKASDPDRTPEDWGRNLFRERPEVRRWIRTLVEAAR